MGTLLEGVLARISSAFDVSEGIDISGNPGPETYPFIIVDNLNFGSMQWNTKKSYEAEQNLQVTVAALDPEQASEIGERAYNTLLPAKAGRPKVALEQGYEVNRHPTGGRTYNQDGVGPNNLTVFYYSFDIRMYLGKEK